MKKEAKKRLYESTLELLKESDYEDLTIGKICHNADVSRQAFYLHYRSKDEVLKEIYFNLLKLTYLDRIEDKDYIESDEFIMKVIDVYEAHATIFITLEKWHYQDLLSQEK
ncbi:TetR/AcrR family transcriptional regulator [Coprobacillus sp. K06]|nr:TetR/AcrR family transcriptional regulator [Coprobacillus sp. K06]MBX9165243.1 TetR/AcrR family transcriptional regulator [Coprobacillus sp. K06]